MFSKKNEVRKKIPMHERGDILNLNIKNDQPDDIHMAI
jgi:hypothetical protein